jgi:hypothetical protein
MTVHTNQTGGFHVPLPEGDYYLIATADDVEQTMKLHISSANEWAVFSFENVREDRH